MVNVLIVMVGIIIAVWILSQADITITVKHEYKTETATPQSDTDLVTEQKDLDTATEKQPQPSMDDIVKLVQDIIGGVDDADNIT